MYGRRGAQVDSPQHGWTCFILACLLTAPIGVTCNRAFRILIEGRHGSCLAFQRDVVGKGSGGSGIRRHSVRCSGEVCRMNYKSR